jgi:hypothetical protein
LPGAFSISPRLRNRRSEFLQVSQLRIGDKSADEEPQQFQIGALLLLL